MQILLYIGKYAIIYIQTHFPMRILANSLMALGAATTAVGSQ